MAGSPPAALVARSSRSCAPMAVAGRRTSVRVLGPGRFVSSGDRLLPLHLATVPGRPDGAARARAAGAICAPRRPAGVPVSPPGVVGSTDDASSAQTWGRRPCRRAVAAAPPAACRAGRSGTRARRRLVVPRRERFSSRLSSGPTNASPSSPELMPSAASTRRTSPPRRPRRPRRRAVRDLDLDHRSAASPSAPRASF